MKEVRLSVSRIILANAMMMVTIISREMTPPVNVRYSF